MTTSGSFLTEFTNRSGSSYQILYEERAENYSKDPI